MALARKAATRSDDHLLAAKSRLNAREIGRRLVDTSTLVVSGGKDCSQDTLEAFSRNAGFEHVFRGQAGAIQDMDLVARSLLET
jgi:hypothetical protein